MDIRKIVVRVEETRRSLGRDVSPPTRTVIAAAVLRNPLAGRYVEDLGELEALGAGVSALMTE